MTPRETWFKWKWEQTTDFFGYTQTGQISFYICEAVSRRTVRDYYAKNPFFGQAFKPMLEAQGLTEDSPYGVCKWTLVSTKQLTRYPYFDFIAKFQKYPGIPDWFGKHDYKSFSTDSTDVERMSLEKLKEIYSPYFQL